MASREGRQEAKGEEDTLKLCSTESLCYGLNVCVPSDSYIEALSPNEMAFGDGAFERCLDLNEAMRVGLVFS